MAKSRQLRFEKIQWKYRYCHGGNLRNARAGRKERPISKKDPIHLVFKANKELIGPGLRSPSRFKLVSKLLEKYSRRFFVKIESASIQADHIHIVARLARRSHFQNFMRVLAGQIAQTFLKAGFTRAMGVTDTSAAKVWGQGADGKAVRAKRVLRKLWKHRPFTRVVRGRRDLKRMFVYVKLNELEGAGEIPYRKERTRAITYDEWSRFWG